jgi:cation transport protein ChaC
MTWVFAYGSLMGDALLSRYPSRPARLVGFHRSFRHVSERRWGSPDGPCPVLGLAEGGECWGVAYEVPEVDRARVMRALDRREGASERKRRRCTVETPHGPVESWVWVSPSRRGGEDEPAPAEVERRLRRAHGVVGNGAEYVRTLVHAMELHGLRDPLVDGLWERLRG